MTIEMREGGGFQVSDSDVALTLLPLDRIDEAAKLTAEAFAGRPNAWRAIVGASSSRNEQLQFLQWLFARNLWLRRDSGCNRCVMSGGDLVCSFMFVPPDTPDVSVWDMLRAGLLKLPWLFGLDRFKRLLKAKNIEERELMELGEDVEGVFRLERMVVKPEMQGRGIGTRALGLALLEADLVSKAVILSTQEERNCRFYEALGFEVIQFGTRDIDGESYPIWTMRRPPKARPSGSKTPASPP